MKSCLASVSMLLGFSSPRIVLPLLRSILDYTIRLLACQRNLPLSEARCTSQRILRNAATDSRISP